MRTKAGHQIAIWETLSPGFLIFRFPIYCITRAVAYNIVGPALPQALRILRYPSPGNKDGSSIDPLTLATTCPEERDASSLITAKEKMCLQEDSELVEALENIYSSIPPSNPTPSLPYPASAPSTSRVKREPGAKLERGLVKLELHSINVGPGTVKLEPGAVHARCHLTPQVPLSDSVDGKSRRLTPTRICCLLYALVNPPLSGFVHVDILLLHLAPLIYPLASPYPDHCFISAIDSSGSDESNESDYLGDYKVPVCMGVV
ncbi:hypothetical protein B0H13DRAFT_2312781 [Mycena leptocephala]|nr:hypothetical protein B0H13DRAFT_2312781 [Mycena leptocephala]